MPIIVPARLQRRADGVPVSEIYDDIYHSDSGGLAQARQVFLAGNGLPERWQGRQAFSILETGFGLGLNFLTTFAAWQADAERCAQLHFTSIEKHPFAAADLAVAHAAWPDLASQSAELCSHWPELRPGMHRVELAGGRVVLHLVFSDATALLGDEQAGDHLGTDFDAFYLDGFAPMKNPELWSPALCRALARRAAADATLATWSVAGSVRRALADAGFAVRKAPGFGSKRQMLVGNISKPIGGLLP